MKTYTWKDRKFPEESGIYRFVGTIFRELDTFYKSDQINDEVYVYAEGQTILWDDQIHLANDCHGDFVGPMYGECSMCSRPFSAQEWDNRHTLLDGEDCHEDCCPQCRN